MGHGKPRVIFVSTYPPEPCGIGHVTHELVQALGSLRDVSVIGNIPSNAPPVEGAVTREWRKNEILYPVKILNGVDRASDGPDTIVHVQHHFNLYGGAISVALFPVLILLLRLRGYRVVVQFHSVIDPRELGGLDRRIAGGFPPWLLNRGLGIFYRTIARLGDRILVWTPSMATLLVETYGLKTDRIWIVPHGWEELMLPANEAEPRTELGFGSQRVVMFFGFLDPTKGLGDLLEGFARVHREFADTHLVFAGAVSPHLEKAGKDFLRSLEQQVARLGLAGAVTFTGYIDEGRLEQTLSAANVFVLPYTMLASHGGSASLSRVAGFGKPLVVSRISRFADEIVNGETGLLVTPGRPEEIAAAIRRVLSDPALATRLGDNLRRLAKDRSWRSSAELLDQKLYPSLSGGPSN
ncbi:MAG: glycosyltransferase [Thermoplasmata archaeon]